MTRQEITGRLLGLVDDHLGGLLGDTEDGQHGVDGGDGGEDAGVDDADALEAADVEALVDDGERVLADVAHLGGADRVVDGVGGAAGVEAELLVGLDLGAGGDLAGDPVLEGGLLGDLAGGAHAVDEGGGVVALLVGEVAEVERRLDRGVGRGQVQAAAGAGAGDVGGHAEGVALLGLVVAEAARVEGEGDLVAVHHDVGDVAVGDGVRVEEGLLGGGVGGLAAQEDAGVRVHGGLVGGHGLLELPHDDGLRVVLQVLADAGEVVDDGDAEVVELLLGADAGQQHEARGVDGAGREDGLGAGGDGALGAVLEGEVDAGDGVAADVELGDPGVGEDGQVRALLVAAQEGVDATEALDRRPSSGLYEMEKKPTPCLRAPSWVMCLLKLCRTGMLRAEEHELTQSRQSSFWWRAWTGWTVLRSLFMRRMKSWKVQPLAPMDCQIFRSYSKGLKEMRVLCDEQPPRTLAREWRIEGDQTLLTHGLFGGAVVVVKLAAEQVEPLPQIQHAVIHKVTGTGLDQEDALLGKGLGQAGGDDATGGAAADDDIVVAVDVGDGELGGGHCGGRGGG
ncbi:hypothetical protein ColKHC_07021 [Colletotrichum higginsianum]|nr:hypothetical protein ColKHC_07021 [Colletotrichum higginsianum]